MVSEKIEIFEFKVSEHAYVGRVEKELHNFYLDREYTHPLIIDLNEVSYIQITTLLYLAQFIYKRDLSNTKTYMKLPQSDEVKIFMFTWRFYEIIEELTGKNIFNFIEGNQKKFPPIKFTIEDKTFYLNINKDYFDKYYKEDQLKNLVKKGFFSFVCEPFKEEKQKYLALKKQRRNWSTEKLITDVLQKNLIENVQIGNLLSNTIIFECLTNAANHPESDHLVIGSFYDFTNEEKIHKGDKEKKLYFTIVLWDDGDSIINTLSESINLGNQIRANDSYEVAKKSGLKSWFRIAREDFHSDSKNESMFYDYLPNKESTSDEVLLSSFLPGISRKPINKKDTSQNDSDENFDSSSGTGLGLTLLLKAVIKDLDGSIHVRTDDYLLEITKARKGGGIEYNDMFFYKNLNETDKKDVDFYCKSKLRLYKNKSGPFKGNMITIKIPVNHAL
jgi:hypothetical protein